MDGYAVRHADTAHAPVTLRIAGEIAAGAAPAEPVAAGNAAAIMTGAKIPPGCTAVVQQEWTEPAGSGAVKILRTAPEGHNIRRAGADIACGTEVIAAGALLRPQEIGVLASLGHRFVTVHRRATVAILATGSEIVEPGAPLTAGRIRNSGAYTLAALARQAGAEVRYLGIARDDREELCRLLAAGLKADILVTSGGVSVGAYDFVRPVLEGLGVRLLFTKVNIKPGMPLVFGVHAGGLVFGLPGNPVSGMVTFLEFVRPALRMLMGDRSGAPLVRVRAALAETFEKHDGKRHFLRGILETRDGVPVVRTTGSQVSNILTSLARANCLIVVPEEVTALRAGELVDVELLP
jgi:molybdopterin molybdotransferase